MSDEKANAEREEERAEHATENQQAEEQTDDRDIAELESALEAARKEAEEYREQALRARAEMENVRKRAERDVESARKYALEKFATELLGVRDSLEMGLQAAEEQSGDFDKLKEGIELTGRMLASAMEKFGIEPVNPEGETFDPSYHEAMSAQETDEQPPNTVVNVVQKGYLLNGRVLRPAMVVVSKRPEISDG